MNQPAALRLAERLETGPPRQQRLGPGVFGFSAPAGEPLGREDPLGYSRPLWNPLVALDVDSNVDTGDRARRDGACVGKIEVQAGGNVGRENRLAIRGARELQRRVR